MLPAASVQTPYGCRLSAPAIGRYLAICRPSGEKILMLGATQSVTMRLPLGLAAT